MPKASFCMIAKNYMYMNLSIIVSISKGIGEVGVKKWGKIKIFLMHRSEIKLHVMDNTCFVQNKATFLN